jgi:hypothetical protein
MRIENGSLVRGSSFGGKKRIAESSSPFQNPSSASGDKERNAESSSPHRDLKTTVATQFLGRAIPTDAFVVATPISQDSSPHSSCGRFLRFDIPFPEVWEVTRPRPGSSPPFSTPSPSVAKLTRHFHRRKNRRPRSLAGRAPSGSPDDSAPSIPTTVKIVVIEPTLEIAPFWRSGEAQRCEWLFRYRHEEYRTSVAGRWPSARGRGAGGVWEGSAQVWVPTPNLTWILPWAAGRSRKR